MKFLFFFSSFTRLHLCCVSLKPKQTLPPFGKGRQILYSVSDGCGRLMGAERAYLHPFF